LTVRDFRLGESALVHGGAGDVGSSLYG